MSDFRVGTILESQFSKAAFSEYNKEKAFSYTPNEAKLMQLSVGAIAPDWKLPLMSGDSLRLSDLRGKIVIMDFLVDDPIKEKLQHFLKKRNITMMSVYDGKSIEKLYKINAAPALIIIDTKGKIIFTLDGYSNTLLKDVESIIESSL